MGATGGARARTTREVNMSSLASRPRWTGRSLAAAVALATALILDAGGVSAATVVQSWQTRICDSPSDTATLYVYDTGKGVLRRRSTDTELSGGTTCTVAIHKRSCGWLVSSVGPVLFKLPSVRTSSSGTLTRNLAVTALQARKVRSA
jgi:hypothetical protein